MARSTRSSTLESRSSRLRLPIAKKPIFIKIGPGIGLGYRRNRTAGTWVARVADGRGSNWTKGIGSADDFDEADGSHVLTYWQAQEKARAIARAEHGRGTNKPVTVAEAINAYEQDLRMRGGDRYNVNRIRNHLTPSLGDKVVALLTAKDLQRWRAGFKGLEPASVNRTIRVLKAALNLAARDDERIVNRHAWGDGLPMIPNADRSRNVILDEQNVRRIVAAAYKHSPEFGVLVEAAAVTGARVGQIIRLQVQDLQADRDAPRLMMPVSKKGRGRKEVQHHAVPIPRDLAVRLFAAAKCRPADAPLLLKPSGHRWATSGHQYQFTRAVVAAGLDPDEVTIYALRHTSIVRQIMANVPIRIVAALHDTSVAMIEKTYSRYITDVSDTLARGAMLDISAPVGGNIVPIRA